MASLPTGTVTFLFTDIEGSTRLARRDPEAWERARAQHHTILQQTFEAHGGFVFQVIGDAFCAAFPNVLAAADAALAAQRALAQAAWGNMPIRVRMGIHTGTSEARDGVYHGYLTLAHVQRIMALASGGQILVSSSSAQLLREDASRDEASPSLRDLGLVRLKDFATAEHLFQLDAADLRSNFPPLPTSSATPNNLPVQLTSFIGRSHDLAELESLLTTTRLLTLTGVGGTGKTRLALAAAENCRDDYADGVWLVELAPLADPALTASAIASAVGVREEPNRSLLATLGDYFRSKTALLVLDNCEHMLNEAAQVCDTLLHAAPKLKIIATSREALGIAGETAYRVPSLEIPRGALPLDALSQVASVSLFAERAKAARSDFALSAATAPAVVQICQRLDGIPLAIELAAARVRSMRVEQVAERLDDRFRLLTGGSRTALPRQQTLRGTIDWSHSLLSEPERILLRRLSVFAGGWTLEAAEAVCSSQSSVASSQYPEAASQTVNVTGKTEVADARGTQHSAVILLTSAEVLEQLTRLVDKSLVVLDEQAAEPRYRMLETVRQYAREKLLDAGESEAVRDAHLDFCMRLAEEAEGKIRGPEELPWLARLDAELDNLRAAIEWSLQSDHTIPGLRLVTNLWWFLLTRSDYSETMIRLQELLAKPDAQARTLVRARALSALSRTQVLSQVNDAAQGAAQEALSIAQDLNDAYTIAWANLDLAIVARRNKQFAEALALATTSEARLMQEGHRWEAASAKIVIGGIFLAMGDAERAKEVLSEGAAALRALADQNHLAAVLRWRGRANLQLGLVDEAEADFAQSVEMNIAVGDKRGILSSMAGLAAVRAARGDLANAVCLSGAIERLQSSLSVKSIDLDAQFEPEVNAALRARLAPADFDTAWTQGRGLTLEQAIALALEPASSTTQTEATAAAIPADTSGLTARELDVLRLLAEGLSNDQIAERLVVSAYTVRAHLRAIYGKLGVTTRSAATRFALEHKIV